MNCIPLPNPIVLSPQAIKLSFFLILIIIQFFKMSSFSLNANIDNIAMPSPPPYEVLKLQWQIKELRRMLRLSELNLAKITEPRPLFLEPLTMSPIAPSNALGRAPANHVWQGDHWVHQDSEAVSSIISSSDLSQEPNTSQTTPTIILASSTDSLEQEGSIEETTEVYSETSGNTRKNIYWTKKTISLAPQTVEFSHVHRPVFMAKNIYDILWKSENKTLSFKELSEEVEKVYRIGPKGMILKTCLRGLLKNNEIIVS